jgi:DNA repair photolyase
MIKEIEAKQLLSHSKNPDPWFGIKYSMNLYRGCQHQCIYCDSRSNCYRVENFSDIEVKINALELLPKELSSKRVKGTVGTGAMNDPYMPIERKYYLTGGALEILQKYNFPVHIITKSDMVTRDVHILQDIVKGSFGLVSFTITTCDDELGKIVEPGAPQVSARLNAMRKLSSSGIPVGVTLMPVLPFIEDNWDNIRTIVELAHDHGASYILPAFGMTQRDGQIEYYLKSLDKDFPGVKMQHLRAFGKRYECPANQSQMLSLKFYELCKTLGIATKVPFYQAESDLQQLSFFNKQISI